MAASRAVRTGVRSKLAQLKSDPDLYNRAPIAIQEADAAMRDAEAAPRRDKALAAHLAYMAERRVDIAWALSESRMLEDQRAELSEQRETARLEARTREADRAHRDASDARADARHAERRSDIANRQSRGARQDSLDARSDADYARSEAHSANMDAARAKREAEGDRSRAEIARSDADTARLDSRAAKQRADASDTDARLAKLQAETARSESATARESAEAARDDTRAAERHAHAAEADTAAALAENLEMQQQIDALNARPTERGWVMTLGDVLFATGEAEILGGAASDLDELARFLNRDPQRTVAIEGHTDNVGARESNRGLSERRAEAVRAFLIGQGVAPSRVTAEGMGEDLPVASNDSATGRQQNRRVEVIISNGDEPEAVTDTR